MARDRLQQWPEKARNHPEETKLENRTGAQKRKKTCVRIWKETIADAPSRTTRSGTAATEAPLNPGPGGRKRLARQESGRNSRSRQP